MYTLLYVACLSVSLSTVVADSRDRQGNYGFLDMHTSYNYLKRSVCQEYQLQSYCCNSAVTLLNTAKS